LPDNAGKVRYNYRLRLSAGAQGLLLAEWDRCRWVWNQCVEASNAAYQESMATGVKAECGPALLDKRLTRWRAEHEWLAAGSSVAQQQTIRDFGRARAKALKDRKDKNLSVRQRRGMPRFKSKQRAAPSLNYTLRGFVLDGPQVRLAGGIVVRPVWSRELPGARRVCGSTVTRWAGGGAPSSCPAHRQSRCPQRVGRSGSTGA
jgi:putative transposase